MGHTKVTQAPGQCGGDGQRTIRGSRIIRSHMGRCQGQVAYQIVCVFRHGIKAAGNPYAEQNDNDQGNTHNHALDHICHRSRQKAAGYGIGYDNHSGNDHGYMIINGENGTKQLTAGRKAGSCIGHEENDDNHRCDRHQDVLIIPVSQREEIGQSDGIYFVGIGTDTLGNHQPVHICTDGQANGRPCGFRDTSQIRQTGQAHQKPGGHIRCLRRHSRYQRTHFSAAQVEIAYRFVILGAINTDRNHANQIDGNGDQHDDVST